MRLVRWLVAFLVASCGSAPVQPTLTAPPPERKPAPKLRVVDAAGAVVAGALVTVSDATTGDRISTARTDADGSFLVSGTSAVAVTATAPAGDGWAFEAKFSPTPPGELRLHKDCEPLAGTLRGAPLPTEIWMGRASEDNGDSFAVAVGADGVFHACLVPGAYGIEPMPELASPTLFVHTPATDLELPIASRATLETDSTNVAGVTGETMAQFIKGLPASGGLFALGETNHGSREFFSERAKLTIALARDHGVRLVMMESGYAESLPLDDYINGEKVDIGAAVSKLGYWPWDTKNFLAALADLREANRKRGKADRIHFVGFDMQDTRGAIALIVAAHAVDDAIAPILQKLVDKDGAAWKTMTEAERAPVIAALDPLAARRDEKGLTSSVNRLALAAHELVLRLHALESADPWARLASRDRGMADLALDILSRSGSVNGTLWAHLGHLARTYIIGAPPMGHWLADKLGDRYQVFALLAGGGDARAWDAAQKIGVVPRELPAPPPYSLEAMLAPHRVGPVSYFRFAAASPPAATWLRGLHAIREFGAVHPTPEREFRPFDLRAIDGAILFETVHSTEPTPTGERRK